MIYDRANQKLEKGDKVLFVLDGVIQYGIIETVRPSDCDIYQTGFSFAEYANDDYFDDNQSLWNGIENFKIHKLKI